MAFKFFRQKKKIVFSVMILLMLAFLASPFLNALRHNPAKTVIGYIGDKKITAGDVDSATGSVKLLALHLNLAQRSEEFSAFMHGCNQELGLGWLLLLHEADEMGIRVTDGQVDYFLSQIGATGKDYDRLLAELREKARASEKHLRAAIAQYLQIAGAFRASQSLLPPTLAEVQRHYRDLTEEIELSMVAFPSEQFDKDIGEPDDGTIHKMFDRYKEVLANHPTNLTRFGFGYRLPHQADVAYLLVDTDVVQRAVEPPEAQMMAYWREHQGELTKTVDVPAPPTTQEANETTSAPATAPAKATRQVTITNYAEAKEQIRQILQADAAEERTFELVRQVKKKLEALPQKDDTYALAAQAMQQPARALLDRPIGKLPGEATAVGDLIELLSEGSGVNIVFPFGEHGDYTLDDEIQVQPQAEWEKLTLDEALRKVTSAAKFPDLEWIACRGFANTIFPSKPVSLVPITVGRTGLVSLTELLNDDLLRWVRTGDSRQSPTLAHVVATAKEFQPPESKMTPEIAVGEDFDQAMHVGGLRQGKLLWRLVSAVKSHTPERVTPDIREQIVKDFKTEQGYAKALAAAKEMLSKLEETAATQPAGDQTTPDEKADDDENEEDKTPPTRLEQLAKESDLTVASSGRVTRAEAWLDPSAGLVGIAPAAILGVGVNQDFLDKAFLLAPTDPDKGDDDKPATIAELPRQKKVMLIQRVAYQPATREGLKSLRVPIWFSFGGRGRQKSEGPLISALLANQKRRHDLINWFTWEMTLNGQRIGIKKRVIFAPKFD